MKSALCPLLLTLLACTEPDEPLAGPPTCADVVPPRPPRSDPSAELPPNLLVIVADDFGVDRVGAYQLGVAAPPTPRLDALAASGLRFDRAWATPSCSPSRATLLTGRHGFRTGIGKAAAANDGYPLSLEERTIPELLAQAEPPYSSGAVGKWHLSNFAVGHGQNVLDQGFDHHCGNLGNIRNEEALEGDLQGFYNYEYLTDGAVGRRTEYLTTVEADDAILLMARLPEPWFVYVGLHALHSPAHIPPRHLYSGPTLDPGLVSELGRYNATAEALDHEVGRILDAAPPETFIVFLGDNGTDTKATSGPFPPDRMKLTMYEGGVRVPLLVRSPLLTAPGSRTTALVHTVDLLPTLAELAGLDLPTVSPDLTLDGVSFLPYLTDPDQPSLRDHVYTERFIENGFGPYTTHARAVRDDQFKLIWDQERGYELYELGLDWWEGPNLLAGEPLSEPAAASFDLLRDLLEGDTYRLPSGP